MSSLVFPSALPGVQMDVSREPVHDTKVQTTLSGKELRTTWSTYPRYRYALSFELLRSGASLREFQQFFTMLARHGGMLDSFLFSDPEDALVTDHGFAVGDGVAASWQLQRTLKGDFGDAAGFTYQQQSKPFTNMVKNSSFEASSAGLATNWSVYNLSSATEPHVASIVPGVNGGSAQRISWGTNNTNVKGLTAASLAFVAGQWFTVAFLARAFGSVAGQGTLLNWNNPPSSTVVVANPALSGAWQRYIFQIRWNPGVAFDTFLDLSITQFAAVFGDLDFDDVLVLAGQYDATTLPQPFSTPAAATARKDPAYWPALGDGFEPIFDLKDPPTIYQDGDWGFGSGPGKRQLYPWARSNLLPFSEQFDNAAWAKGTGVTVTANSTAAPDGTVTADTINEGASAATTHQVKQQTIPAPTAGELRCYSAFVKAGTLPNIIWTTETQDRGINFNLGTGAVDGVRGGAVASGVITDPRWPGWFRIWFIAREGATPNTGAYLAGALDGTYAISYTGTSRTFFAWGAMCERVSNLSGPTPYIATPSSAAVTVTDYTVDSLGKVTLPTVPPAGTIFSWDGTYYRRVRFETDSVPADRIALTFWKTGRVSLISVKP